MNTIESIRGRATITVPEAGEILSIGRDAAYDAVRRGQIPALRLGRTIRVPVPELLRLLGATLDVTDRDDREDVPGRTPLALVTPRTT